MTTRPVPVAEKSSFSVLLMKTGVVAGSGLLFVLTQLGQASEGEIGGARPATGADITELADANEAKAATAVAETDVDVLHAKVFRDQSYPSARACAQCHSTHYRQWSISQHAYAQISPVFNAMHGEILKRTNGTNGDFCIRCHTPVGMNLNEPQFMSNIDRHPTSREGVTCIVCHRVNHAYGKISGRLAIVPGKVNEVIYGPTGDSTAIHRFIKEGAATDDPNKLGRKIHGQAEKFFQITTSAFCGTCHDVTLVNGFRLEEAFSEYKMAPAARRGVSCQDCHMGKEPGRFTGVSETNYAWGPAARVGTESTKPRKLTNHLFVGPDYPVVHPALFPLHPQAIREEHEKDDPKAAGLATIREWIQFDWKAGWGTDDFEDEVVEEYPFPERWDSIDDRYDAREIIEDNLKLLEMAAQERLKLLQNGYKLGDIIVARADDRQIRFKIQVMNGTDGHGVPTGFDAERLVWLHVVVKDRHGNKVFESGDLDPNGDVRDLHSLYVHNHELPLDKYLFSLQSKFVTRNVRGGEREQVLAVNYSPSPLPFLRPERRSSVLLGRPGGARKHKKGIEPLGHRWAGYVVKGRSLSENAPYEITVELKDGMVPVNLINEIKGVGFDYDMTPREVADLVVAGHQVIWAQHFEVNLHPKK